MTVHIVSSPSGDWEGLYLDGRLVVEGHSLSWWQVLSAIRIEYDMSECDETWINDVGRLPENLDDVVIDNRSE